MNTLPNIPDPDAFYEAWADAMQGLGDDAAADLNARLVLLLANQIGEQSLLLECIAAARSTSR